MVICIFRFACYNEKRDEGSFSLPQELGERRFLMMQFSVYIRHCASRESLEVHIKRVKSLLPEIGKVSLLSVTDKQYGDIYNFWGKPKSINKSKISKKVISEPIQLEFFSTFALEYISYSPFLIRKSECYALEFSVFKSIGCGLM